jgi:hypothetical protein
MLPSYSMTGWGCHRNGLLIRLIDDTLLSIWRAALRIPSKFSFVAESHRYETSRTCVDGMSSAKHVPRCQQISSILLLVISTQIPAISRTLLRYLFHRELHRGESASFSKLAIPKSHYHVMNTVTHFVSDNLLASSTKLVGSEAYIWIAFTLRLKTPCLYAATVLTARNLLRTVIQTRSEVFRVETPLSWTSLRSRSQRCGEMNRSGCHLSIFRRWRSLFTAYTVSFSFFQLSRLQVDTGEVIIAFSFAHHLHIASAHSFIRSIQESGDWKSQCSSRDCKWNGYRVTTKLRIGKRVLMCPLCQTKVPVDRCRIFFLSGRHLPGENPYCRLYFPSRFHELSLKLRNTKSWNVNVRLHRVATSCILLVRCFELPSTITINVPW